MNKYIVAFLIVFSCLTVIPLMFFLIENLFYTDFDDSSLGKLIDKL
jgi:hypothetical protein